MKKQTKNQSLEQIFGIKPEINSEEDAIRIKHVLDKMRDNKYKIFAKGNKKRIFYYGVEMIATPIAIYSTSQIGKEIYSGEMGVGLRTGNYPDNPNIGKTITTGNSWRQLIIGSYRAMLVADLITKFEKNKFKKNYNAIQDLRDCMNASLSNYEKNKEWYKRLIKKVDPKKLEKILKQVPENLPKIFAQLEKDHMEFDFWEIFEEIEKGNIKGPNMLIIKNYAKLEQKRNAEAVIKEEKREKGVYGFVPGKCYKFSSLPIGITYQQAGKGFWYPPEIKVLETPDYHYDKFLREGLVKLIKLPKKL